MRYFLIFPVKSKVCLFSAFWRVFSYQFQFTPSKKLNFVYFQCFDEFLPSISIFPVKSKVWFFGDLTRFFYQFQDLCKNAQFLWFFKRSHLSLDHFVESHTFLRLDLSILLSDSAVLRLGWGHPQKVYIGLRVPPGTPQDTSEITIRFLPKITWDHQESMGTFWLGRWCRSWEADCGINGFSGTVTFLFIGFFSGIITIQFLSFLTLL